MARCSRNHKELAGGVGKCSVPMWSGGVPAGFCDADAYGPEEKGQLRYEGYIPFLACHAHGGPMKPADAPAPSESEPTKPSKLDDPICGVENDEGQVCTLSPGHGGAFHVADCYRAGDGAFQEKWPMEPPCGTCGGSREVASGVFDSEGREVGEPCPACSFGPACKTCRGSGNVPLDPEVRERLAQLSGGVPVTPGIKPCPDCSPEPAPPDPWEELARNIEGFIYQASGMEFQVPTDPGIGQLRVWAARIRSLPRPQGGASSDRDEILECGHPAGCGYSAPIADTGDYDEGCGWCSEREGFEQIIREGQDETAGLRADLEALRARPQIGEEVAATALRFAEQIEQCGGLLAFKDYRDSWAPWLRSLAARLAPEDQDAS